MKKIMYHCTRREFLPEIMKYGLQPIRPLNRIIKGKLRGPETETRAVFLSEYPFKWMQWAQELPDGRFLPGAIITVDVQDLKMIRDPSKNHDDDWACLEPIPPERFLEIHISTEESPCSFKKLNQKTELLSGRSQVAAKVSG